MKNSLFPAKLVGLVCQLKESWKTDRNLPLLETFTLEGYPDDNHLRYPLYSTGVKEHSPLDSGRRFRLAIPNTPNTVECISAIMVELYDSNENLVASYPVARLTGAFALAVEVEILTVILGSYGFRVTTE